MTKVTNTNPAALLMLVLAIMAAALVVAPSVDEASAGSTLTHYSNSDKPEETWYGFYFYTPNYDETFVNAPACGGVCTRYFYSSLHGTVSSSGDIFIDIGYYTSVQPKCKWNTVGSGSSTFLECGVWE